MGKRHNYYKYSPDLASAMNDAVNKIEKDKLEKFGFSENPNYSDMLSKAHAKTLFHISLSLLPISISRYDGLEPISLKRIENLLRNEELKSEKDLSEEIKWNKRLYDPDFQIDSPVTFGIGSIPTEKAVSATKSNWESMHTLNRLFMHLNQEVFSKWMMEGIEDPSAMSAIAVSVTYTNACSALSILDGTIDDTDTYDAIAMTGASIFLLEYIENALPERTQSIRQEFTEVFESYKNGDIPPLKVLTSYGVQAFYDNLEKSSQELDVGFLSDLLRDDKTL